MKSLIIVFTFITTFITAQTKLDTLVFNDINSYRTSLGLKEVRWETNAYKASNKHTTFLYNKNLVIWPSIFSGHTEDTLVNPKDRYEYFFKSKDWKGIGEVALAISKNYKVDDTLLLNKIAKEIVNGWKESKEHNNIIKSPDYVFAGVSCRFFTKSPGMKGWDSYRIVATMMFIM